MVLDVVAILTPNKGKEARLEELLTTLASKVQEKETKVTRYLPYKTTHEDGSVEFVVVERYPDEEEFKAHTSTEHFAELGKIVGDEDILAKGLNIMKCSPLKGGFDSR